jgi:hypothetical protein
MKSLYNLMDYSCVLGVCDAFVLLPWLLVVMLDG